MIDRQLVIKKLADISAFADELERILGFSDQEIGADFLKQRAAERLLQLIVDSMVDINLHLIRAEKLAIPDDFQSSFQLLAKQGAFPAGFAKKVAPVVGLRNRIVHRYASVDMGQFLRELRKDRSDFWEYLRLVKKHIG
ncbi:MAG: DUF86 domain-containing protein [Candidatus Aenigmarchaeota archaeon]|nr:DUF86 domain-containing protein [Candidatus Aenigmarchaeota archaeon]